MKDNIAAPNLGQASRDYDAQYFWQSYRSIEQWMDQVVSKGDVQVASLSADEITVTGTVTLDAVAWQSGIGSPEGVVVAAVGSLYTRTDGGAGTTLYVKESGTGNTGWVGK
jgi:hypothetical protein